MAEGEPLPTEGFRTTVRGAVVGDRFAYRRWHSHDPLAVDSCLIAHPLVEEVIADGRFPGARQVTIRAGARTGERLVVVDGSAEGVAVPDGVVVVGKDELRRGRRAWYHEEVAGRAWRISATSFFQSRPDGAELLVRAVRTAAAGVAPGARSMADLCAGVGLFAGTVGAGRPVIAVERDRSAVADARHNLEARAGPHRAGVRSKVGGPTSVDLVVADPPRTGLARTGVRGGRRHAGRRRGAGELRPGRPRAATPGLLGRRRLPARPARRWSTSSRTPPTWRR